MLLIETVLQKAILEDISREKLPEGVLCRLTYPVCKLGTRNANNRIYEKEVWDNVLEDKDLLEKLNNRALFGHAEHPEQTQSDLQLTSHVIHEMRIDEDSNILYQKFDVLDTPTGRIVDTLLRAGCQVGVSTRAEGDLEEAQDDDGPFSRVIPESYRYVTTDFTADPSTFGVVPQDIKRNVVTEIKKVLENKDAKEADKHFATCLIESMGDEEGDEANRWERAVQDLQKDITFLDLVKEHGADSDEVFTYVSNKQGLESSKSDVEDFIKVGLEKEVEKTTENLAKQELIRAGAIKEIKEDSEKKSKVPKKYTEEEQLQRAKKDHDVIVGKERVEVDESEVDEEIEDSVLEKLAALEHDQWIEWAKDILETEDISEERAERWKDLFISYDELDEEIKEKDREWARKSLTEMDSVEDEFEVDEKCDKEEVKRKAIAKKKKEESKANESKSISSISKEITELKILEAFVRAERDKAVEIIEEIETRSNQKLEVKILTNKLKGIIESNSKIVSVLKSKLEEKALQTKELYEKCNTIKSDFHSDLIELKEAIVTAGKLHISELNKMKEDHKKVLSNLKKKGVIETENRVKDVRDELISGYVRIRVEESGLVVGNNSQALLEESKTFDEVDNSLNEIRDISRRNALHSEPIDQIVVKESEVVDSEQEDVDRSVGAVLEGMGYKNEVQEDE